MRSKGLWAAAGSVLVGLLLCLYLYQKAHAVKTRVVLYRGGQAVESLTVKKNVGGVIREQGISWGPHDLSVPPISAPVTEGMEIDLGQVERRVKTVQRKASYATQTVYTETLNVGEIIDVEAGKDGQAEQETETYFLNGEEAFEKVLKSKVLIPVKNAKVLEGTSLKQKLYPLKKRASVRKIMEMEATAYYPGAEDTWPYASGISASGLKAGYGIIAVDPKVVRLKTPVYVEGYGYAIAGDKGGAIKGRKVDLCFDTYEEAVRFGRKKVKVYILR